MTNPLQSALIPVAKAAGFFVNYDKHTDGYHVWKHVAKDHDGNELSLPNGGIVKMPVCVLPGRNGTLEGEVEVVLGWLVDAEYEPHPGRVTISPEVKVFNIYWYEKTGGMARCSVSGYGDTLHAALTAAVLALAKVKA